MNRQKRHSILIASCAGGLLHSLGLFLLAIVWPFCGPSEIDHYFRDAYLLLKLACTDTHNLAFLSLPILAWWDWCSLWFWWPPTLWFCIMCAHILQKATIKHFPPVVPTSQSVILFFTPVIFVYIRPATTLPEDKVFTLFYTIIVPMLNPLIYTLRNMEMKNSIRRVWCNKRFWEGNLMIWRSFVWRQWLSSHHSLCCWFSPANGKISQNV